VDVTDLIASVRMCQG